jgi:hypothetical protein
MQYRETPLQEKTSFILPPHFLHFMFLVYPEKGSNGNTRQLSPKSSDNAGNKIFLTLSNQP